ncbi:MAG: DUF3866 family protein [Actinomycetaceae bacterium]|nr:DUF3866 family protein [Actinomycetaceae bacterium]
MIYRDGEVQEIQGAWAGAQVVLVKITKANSKSLLPVGSLVKAISYTRICGDISEGESVRLECSALALRLGTGGMANVVTVLDRLPQDFLPDGHMVKARYTPTQVMVAAADEQDAFLHEHLTGARLRGTPVVATDLHSQLPAVIAGAKSIKADAKVAYVMTDGAALPLAFSRQVAALREAGWIKSTVTCGQAFGGDFEAVSIPSALQVAKVAVEPDVIVIGQGPGNLGGDTEFGFTGVDVAWALTAAKVLQGRPIASLRISDADKRARHFGLSHHTATALQHLTQVSVELALPHIHDSQFATEVRSQVLACAAPRHAVVNVDVEDATAYLLSSPVPLRTMGRSLKDDPYIFISAFAAGKLSQLAPAKND